MGASVFSQLIEGATPLASRQGPHCPRQGLPWAERQLNQGATWGPGEAPGENGLTSIPAWEEAAQLAAQFLAVPMAVVTVADRHTEYFRAAYGLSSLGVGNPLSQQRQIPLESGLGLYVLDGEQPVVFSDTVENPVVSQSLLVSTYGIRAYCGVPLITATGACLGTLAAMDVQPRTFTERDLAFLAMAARWGMSEYERQTLQNAKLWTAANRNLAPSSLAPDTLADALRLPLVTALSHNLPTPLTTILGMTTMLSREIYGPLTPKQREYTDIVHRSSQMMLGLVNEILDLGAVGAPQSDLTPTSLDLAVLGQQVLTALTPVAEARGQTLALTVEPHETQWVLDQRTIKQILYHLAFSIMQVAGDSSTLKIHACRRGQALSLALWVSNPWLGEGLPTDVKHILETLTADGESTIGTVPKALSGLLLSRHLAQRHGGQLGVSGQDDIGHRLVVLLPPLEALPGQFGLGQPRPEAAPASSTLRP